MPDNPAEYVAKLEADLRSAQSDVRTWKSAATSAAQTAERALARLAEWKPIVDAAVEYYEQDGRAGTHRALCNAVESEIKRRESAA